MDFLSWIWSVLVYLKLSQHTMHQHGVSTSLCFLTAVIQVFKCHVTHLNVNLFRKAMKATNNYPNEHFKKYAFWFGCYWKKLLISSFWYSKVSGHFRVKFSILPATTLLSERSGEPWTHLCPNIDFAHSAQAKIWIETHENVFSSLFRCSQSITCSVETTTKLGTQKKYVT